MSPGQRQTTAPAPRRGRAGPTPILISPRLRAALVLAALVALYLLLRAAPGVLIVTLGGATLALLLSFPVRALSGVMPRGLAILVTFLALLGLLGLTLFALIPPLIEQLAALIEATPALAARTDSLLRDLLRPLQRRGFLADSPDEIVTGLQQDVFGRAQALARGLLARLLGAVVSAFTVVLQIFGMFFIAIYLLIDIRKLKAAYLRLVPPRYRRDAHKLWNDFALSLSRYLGGLAVVIVVQGVLATLALSVLGVPYALALGAWVMVVSILPYVGAWLGAIPSVLVALFVSPTTALLTALAYVAIQQVEGNLLTPRIQGQALRLHPILVFLAVFGAGEAAGLAGAIFAVPALAVLRVLFDFFRARLRVYPAARTPERAWRATASAPAAPTQPRGGERQGERIVASAAGGGRAGTAEGDESPRSP